jgi:hypothetical protein
MGRKHGTKVTGGSAGRYVLTLFIFCASLIFMTEDILTTVFGYETLQTDEVFPITKYAIGVFVVALQIVLGYVLFSQAGDSMPRNASLVEKFASMFRISTTRWVLGLIVLLVTFAFDTYTDYLYRNGGSTTFNATTMLVTLFIFTIGSEVAFTFSLDQLKENSEVAKYCLDLFRRLLSNINESRVDLMERINDAADNEDRASIKTGGVDTYSFRGEDRRDWPEAEEGGRSKKKQPYNRRFT